MKCGSNMGTYTAPGEIACNTTEVIFNIRKYKGFLSIYVNPAGIRSYILVYN